ncbi:MAG TPA: cytochrome P450, partial [Stellaceae bacterium]|nr:cytochrome P450 [Stellaceae bacterium]
MSESIALAGPVPRQGPQSFLAFLRTLRDNSIATFGEVAFEEPFFETRTFWRRVLLVHDPAGIKHVLLDNAENYGRTELTRRLLEPGLGHGLLTSEGETWRRHRRIMAPSFHHRAIQSYVPVMTEVAEGLAGEWGSLAPGAEIDVARAMMHATLHIISKTMFSQDSDDIVDVVERGVEQYQAKIRPTFFDMIGLPRWFPRFAAKRVADAALGEFDRSIDRLLSARREGMDAGANPDLLTRLMSARDEETGGGMSAGEIRDQVVTIFMAGHETTALALS